MSRNPNYKTILNAKAATGIGNPIRVTDYKDIMVLVSTASSANLTVKCQGTVAYDSAVPPDFSAAQTTANSWDFMEMVDLQDTSIVVPGDTGVAFAGTDDVRQFEINTDGVDWINFRVTAYAAGNVTVRVVGLTNA